MSQSDITAVIAPAEKKTVLYGEGYVVLAILDHLPENRTSSESTPTYVERFTLAESARRARKLARNTTVEPENIWIECPKEASDACRYRDGNHRLEQYDINSLLRWPWCETCRCPLLIAVERSVRPRGPVHRLTDRIRRWAL